MDDFIEEFYEEWMNTVIEQIPLTNRAPPHSNDILSDVVTNHDEEEYDYNNYQHPRQLEPIDITDEEYSHEQSYYEQQMYYGQQYPTLYPNYIHNQMYHQQNNVQTTNVSDNNIYDSLVNNLYRLRRTLQIQNELNRQSNSIFDELISLVTDGLTENIPNDIELEDVKVVLTPEEFDKLKKNVITDNNFERYKENTCNICMENYNVEEKITELDCSHVFHSDCIQYWLCNEHVTCPICRKDTREGTSLKS